MVPVGFLHLPDDHGDRRDADPGLLHERRRPLHVVGIDRLEEVLDPADGGELLVPPDERYEAFTVTATLPPARRAFSFTALPGGGLSRW